ncbi:hypothetical protein EW145_g7265 [Phellinidium pouzarii]|uniref:40S ribosomal protein S21 n=1 Tax=Phellinidium pouzarii TaxID=167371 RepID=A0A4S4KLT2_9AGAM|nr:hypothetical protein EW145_g7265 [Phellinidium pouzarii]
MENDQGVLVDLYVPRKCAATNRLITSKDHASVQISVVDVDANGKALPTSTTFALCGQVRANAESDDSINRLATKEGSLTGALLTAAYESTRGRSRALREREAVTAPSSSQAAPNLRPNGVNPYRHPTALLSASAALNSGVVGLFFFSESCRTDLLIPGAGSSLSSVSSAYMSVGSRNGGESAMLTWSAKRMYHVPDTAITSALLGGAFNAWKRGLMAIPSGAFTAALACTTLQILVNELDVQRIRFVSARQGSASPSVASDISANSDSPSTSLETASTGAAEQSEQAPSFGQRLLGFIGITKVSEEEYLRRLKARREMHLARIRELEEEQQRSEESIEKEL